MSIDRITTSPSDERFRRSVTKPLAVVAGFLLLAGCDTAASGVAGVSTGAALGIASTAFIINEDKLPTDLIAEAVTGLDCNTIRKQKDKGPLCRPARQEVIEAPVYCYKTLGRIDCFDRPNPYGYQQQTIN
jgi:hypothetical protein